MDDLQHIWENINFKSSKEFFLSPSKRSIVYEYIDSLITDTTPNSTPCYVNYIKVPNIKLCYKNINSEEQNIQNSLLKACISVPTLYKPVRINSSFYVDGAFLDNTPITPLKDKELDIIFVLRFDHASENYVSVSSNTTIIEIVFEDDKTLRNYFYFNKELTQKLVLDGYKQSHKVLENVFKEGFDIKYIQNLEGVYTKESEKNIIPKTGEEIVNKLNKLNKIFKTEFVDSVDMNDNDIEILN